jgi:hypothetical protein
LNKLSGDDAERMRTPQNLINSAIARAVDVVVTLKLFRCSNIDDKLCRKRTSGRQTQRDSRASKSCSLFLSTSHLFALLLFPLTKTFFFSLMNSGLLFSSFSGLTTRCIRCEPSQRSFDFLKFVGKENKNN